MDLKRKAGPLPLWAWIAMAAAVGAVVYIRARRSGGLATPADPGPVDPAANDLITGTGLVSNLPLSYVYPAPPAAPDTSTIAGFGSQQPANSGSSGPSGPRTIAGFGIPLPALTGSSGPSPISDASYDGFSSGYTNTPATGMYSRAAQLLSGAADTPIAAPIAASVDSVPADQRQPAHPHEQAHAPAPTHYSAPPASTRFNAPSSRTRAPHSEHSPHAPGAIPYPVGRPQT